MSELLEHVHQIISESPEKLTALVAVDLRKVLNSFTWELINDEPQRKSISDYLRYLIKNYLSSRAVPVEREVFVEIITGVPQESAIAFNERFIQRCAKTERVKAIALPMTGNKRKQPYNQMSRTDDALFIVQDCTKVIELQLAPQKQGQSYYRKAETQSVLNSTVWEL